MIKYIGSPNKCFCAKPVKIQCMQILIVLLVSKTFFQETFCFHFDGHKLQALSKTDNLIMLSQLGPRCMHQGFFLPPRSVSPLRSENCAFHTFSEFSSFSAVTVFHRLGNILHSHSFVPFIQVSGQRLCFAAACVLCCLCDVCAAAAGPCGMRQGALVVKRHQSQSSRRGEVLENGLL